MHFIGNLFTRHYPEINTDFVIALEKYLISKFTLAVSTIEKNK